MNLPPRDRGDELLPAGEFVAIRRRLRGVAAKHDLATVIVCAFDHRTRMLPFIFADTRMVPAGVRAIGSALADAGFDKTRIVLQQWSRRFRPSRMQLDGRVPDMLLISSMDLHTQPCIDLIRDACLIEPAHRPLIVVGGPRCLYRPWGLFGDEDPSAAADAAVTGEAYVLLALLEVVLAERAEGEPLRQAFARARDAGALDAVPGLVYGRGGGEGRGPEELVDTGIQRLVGDLDELPNPVLGYRLLEPPGRGAALAAKAVEASRIRTLSPLSSIVMTLGCKFSCPYCPIPAYNQRQYRVKTGARLAEDMGHLNKEYGLKFFFGADDNFLNDRAHTLDMVETLAEAMFDGVPLRRRVRWHTEATVHDTLQMKDHLPLIRRAGCRGLWLGVEDITGTLVKKGQDADKTLQAFRLLRQTGICPMPMMMHHDSQPLWSRGSDYGLLNQVRLLRQAGAVSLQVLMLTPSAGSKLYEETYTSGQVFESVGSRRADPYMYDGNYVIASQHPQPWRKQLNLLTAYLYFYNPLWLLKSILGPKGRLGLKPAGMQLVGMMGLVHTIRRTLGWALRLLTQPIRRLKHPPAPTIPMRTPAGQPAPHAPAALDTPDKRDSQRT